MKWIPKYWIQCLLVNDIVYKLFSPFIYVAERLKASRENYINASKKRRYTLLANKIFQDNKICNGPFSGIEFSSTPSSASSTYAKLLGSYESEIHPFLNKVLVQKYHSIINIGCDDGYYALGFAKLMPFSIVEAYDINKDALRRVYDLAVQNQLQGNIRFAGRYDSKTVEQLDENIRNLFIVDCEGDEIHIFTKKNVHKFRNSDLIIELHIHLYPQMEDYFRSIFAASHNIEIVNSVDDHLKAKLYSYPELDGLDYELRRFITQEREVFMQWIFLSAKKVTE